MIYSAGECSVCASGGDAVFMRSIESALIFFMCSACGCAWSSPPVAYQVDSIDPPERFAPNGFAIAKLSEISESGMAQLIAAELPDDSAELFDGYKGWQKNATKSA